MKAMHVAVIAALGVAFGWTTAQAGEVKVEGVHICCPMCVKAIGETLGDVDGVSGASADKDTRTVTFNAADQSAAKAGIEALADAGFHGKATMGKAPIQFPSSGTKKGQKADRIVVQGVHLCCPGCVKIVAKTLDDAKIEGLQDKACDRDAKTVTVEGQDIEVLAVIEALNKAGFHGTVE